MASESSELTFVRCPSCRSLVPVSASRCRICNNPLDGGGKSAEGDAAKQGGRVRQKTVSASADEILQMQSESTRNSPAPAAPLAVQGQPGFGDEGDHEEVDPLADFLQEFEAEAASSAASAPPPSVEKPVAAANDDNDDDFDSFLDELDSYDTSAEAPAPVTQQVPFTAPVEEPPLRSSTPDKGSRELESGTDPLASFMTTDDDFDLDIAPQPVQQVAPPEPEYVPEPPPPPPVRQAPPRQQVEKRPAPAPQQQAPKQHAQQPQAKQARPSHEEKGQRDQRNNHSHQGGQERRDNAPRDRGQSQRHEQRIEEPRKGGHQSEARSQERAPSRPETQHAGPKTGKMRPGRLFGWLVSFESPDGRAIELREGKFFVTGSSIRSTDLVIEDASISTPHALMSVSADHGLLIQDLMSERGVFVRVGERGQYKREDGVVDLKHGDWVRFGDVEFLVTVVPSGR